MRSTRSLGSFGLLALLSLVMFSACNKKEKSSATGWSYNDPQFGGFEKSENVEQTSAPGMIFIEGGTFVMGNTEQDVMFEYDNIPRRVTVSSFYMDETEVSNINYREYIYWLERTFNSVYPEYVKAALPDTLVWREELSYNEPYVEHYFRHPAYDEYPVVGVNWLQANEFCRWRTDRVNELKLIESGIIEFDPDQVGEDHFNTKSYLLGKYEGIELKGMKNYDPTGEETRKVRFEDGIMTPDYRLPTEAEWEYAALALIGTQPAEGEERYTERRIYPWSGDGVRYTKHGKNQGDILANFARGRGDYMGVAGALNDNAEITAPVHSYLPNDFGLYNMAGNVSEWCLDTYRALTSQDAQDLNPFRGNNFQTLDLDEEGAPQRDSLGRIKYREYTQEEIGNRLNYRKSNVIDYNDGDEESGIVYDSDVTTLVSNKSKVIKGGSWQDMAYYLSPGERRYMDEDQASATVGFRCAMIRVGSADGKTFKSKGKSNSFKSKK
ncbi:MAG: SUMF1/EgtB/PvdO family nonheme iron enzyme [Bacteroidetes bacterium]|nr:SUMF1/EgtB/PvdO family nonheme iron enzyme [Bacteroidota bacterium]